MSFVSLQHELRAGDADILDPAGVRRLGEQFADFADTAAVIAALDLVIAVDTSVAHLAAAMGRPLWLLPSFGGLALWVVQGRHDSPWYPTVRLFRQTAPGDWCGAIEAVGSCPRRHHPPTPERLALPAFRWT